MFDIFISHASEDKASVVVPLVDALTKYRISIWVDYLELRIGQSLRERIDEGLSRSRFGAVILSPAFFEKRWTNRELNGMFALDRDRSNRLLPVWHNVSPEFVSARSPILADVVAARTNDGIKPVARKLAALIRADGAFTTVDAELEKLICQYDDIAEKDDVARRQAKHRVRDAMKKRALRVRDIARYCDRPTEGGLLAYVAIMQGTPRRREIGNLVGTLRETDHRYVWQEALLAIAEYIQTCAMQRSEMALTRDEMRALRHKRLVRDSGSALGMLEKTLVDLETKLGTLHDHR